MYYDVLQRIATHYVLLLTNIGGTMLKVSAVCLQLLILNEGMFEFRNWLL